MEKGGEKEEKRRERENNCRQQVHGALQDTKKPEDEWSKGQRGGNGCKLVGYIKLSKKQITQNTECEEEEKQSEMIGKRSEKDVD